LNPLIPDLDVTIIRENTEGFYPDRNLAWGYGEFKPTDDVALSLRVITGVACDRFARFSLDYAAAQGESVLHIAHKRTALPQTEGLFIGAFEKLSSEYPTIRSIRCGWIRSVRPSRVGIRNFASSPPRTCLATSCRIRHRALPAVSGSRRRYRSSQYMPTVASLELKRHRQARHRGTPTANSGRRPTVRNSGIGPYTAWPRRGRRHRALL
jgi:hypothetical protein